MPASVVKPVLIDARWKRCELKWITWFLTGDRCIGCGLCVSTCPADALTLIRRPESEQMKVPRDMVQAAIQLGKARGKLGSGKLISMLIKSKVDRFLAAG